jgi:hypothetical protein
MLLALYPSKTMLKACVGESLNYRETSLFGPEYRSDGELTVANRPHLSGIGREFFATVTMRNDRIVKVS